MPWNAPDDVGSENVAVRLIANAGLCAAVRDQPALAHGPEPIQLITINPRFS